MKHITMHSAVWMTVAATTGVAHGEVVGASALTLSNAEGFIPVVSCEPSNGFGVASTGKRGRDSSAVDLPFAGWSDFGLASDQRVDISWDFTATAPDRYLAWSISPLESPGQVLAGLAWSGSSWNAVGVAPILAGGAGHAAVQLSSLAGPQFYRLAFSGLSAGLEQSPLVGVSFVPSPGAAALIALAGFMGVRRRR
jgi:MYXO-CTERM domain-containing protein